MRSAKRVLLVDDDEMLRVSLADQLSAGGHYETVEARTYAEGLKRGTEGLYEFMVLDVGLPDGDGRDLCRALRDDGVTTARARRFGRSRESGASWAVPTGGSNITAAAPAATTRPTTMSSFRGATPRPSRGGVGDVHDFPERTKA